MKLTKPQLKVLEKVFAAEVEAAVTERRSPICQLRPSKALKVCEQSGYVRMVSETRRYGECQVIVTGHVLTELGRLEYCLSCEDAPDE